MRLGYRMQSMSRAANSRCSYARGLLELAPACVSPEKTSARRKGGEEKEVSPFVSQLNERHWGQNHLKVIIKTTPSRFLPSPLRRSSPLPTASSPEFYHCHFVLDLTLLFDSVICCRIFPEGRKQNTFPPVFRRTVPSTSFSLLEHTAGPT